MSRKLNHQHSLSSVEQSLNMISPPREAPVIIYPGPKRHAQDMSKEDLEILNRLEKLRHGESNIPSEEEMASRLAKLKGLPPDYYTKPSKAAYVPPETRTQAQQSEDLIKQVMDEVSLEGKDDRGSVPLGFHMPASHDTVPTTIGFPMPSHPADIAHPTDIGLDHLDINELNDLISADNEKAGGDVQSTVVPVQPVEPVKKPSKLSKMKKPKKSKKKGDLDKENDPKKEKKRRKLFRKDKKVKSYGGAGEETSSDELFSGGDSSPSHYDLDEATRKKKTLKMKKEVDLVMAMYVKPVPAGAHAKLTDDSDSSDEESDSTDSEYTTTESDNEGVIKK